MTSITDLLLFDGNDKCADCHSPKVEFVSIPYHAFICIPCKTFHERIYSHIHIRSINSQFSQNELDNLKQSQGNITNKKNYEALIPSYYKRPYENCSNLLRREFIYAKYHRQEFKKVSDSESGSTYLDDGSDPSLSDPSSVSGNRLSTISNSNPSDSFLFKSGTLLKRLRDKDKFVEHTFELSMKSNYLRYFRANDDKTITSISLDRVNVSLLDETIFQVPDNTMIISNIVEGRTHNIWVRHDQGAVIMSWYQAVRGAKFHRCLLNVTGSGEKPDISRISEQLTYDFTIAGFLEKTGPAHTDRWRQRWCTLGGRRLVYSATCHCPLPKGEIIIGNKEDGFDVRLGVPEGWRRYCGFTFTLETPDRTYVFHEPNSKDIRDRWVACIQLVIQAPMSDEDRKDMVSIARRL